MAYLNKLAPDAEPTEYDEDWQHGHSASVARRRLATQIGGGISKPPMTKERYTAGFQGQSMRDRRQMPMFTVKSLEGHVHEECPQHWAAQNRSTR